MPHTHIEGTGKPIKVVAPVGCDDYISEGREYTPFNHRENIFGGLFDIFDDTGERISTLEKKSAHLFAKDWIVTEREPNV